LGKDVKKLRALEFKVDDAFNRNHLPKSLITCFHADCFGDLGGIQ